MTHHIHRVAVLGAGTMGAAIAAHAANAGLLVDLLDITPPGAKGKERNGIVKAGFERMLKAKPAALMESSLAEHIRLGNFEDDFERLQEADWILEAGPGCHRATARNTTRSFARSLGCLSRAGARTAL